IGVALLAVHHELARAGLDPDAGDGILALAGRIGAAELVQLALGGSLRRSGLAGDFALAQIGECTSLSHDQSFLLFFGLSAATSSLTGCCASCGWLAPL